MFKIKIKEYKKDVSSFYLSKFFRYGNNIYKIYAIEGGQYRVLWVTPSGRIDSTLCGIKSSMNYLKEGTWKIVFKDDIAKNILYQLNDYDSS